MRETNEAQVNPKHELEAKITLALSNFRKRSLERLSGDSIVFIANGDIVE